MSRKRGSTNIAAVAVSGVFLCTSLWVGMVQQKAPFEFLKDSDLGSIVLMDDGSRLDAYEPDVELAELVRIASRELTAKRGWRSYAVNDHLAGKGFRKGDVTVEIWFWYKRVTDKRKAKEPPQVHITNERPSPIERAEALLYGKTHPDR